MVDVDRTTHNESSDVVVVGAGLAGLVAATEIAERGRSVIVLDQEPPASLGGQAWWSFGGLFLVDTPEQRRMGVRDSADLAWHDWESTAAFDRDEDAWPRRWARAYVEFAAGEKRSWLRSLGIRLFPIVGWAERGGAGPGGPGNSVPRFHITWGTGPGVLAPFIAKVRPHVESGRIRMLYRHRVDAVEVAAGAVTGVSGQILEWSDAARGRSSSRTPVGDFRVEASAVVLTTGGIGGSPELVRRYWPERLGPAPRRMLSGVPAHVDGRGWGIAEAAGARLIGTDRMWHYTEGITNWDPVWPSHGIRILPGPSSLWLDATGERLPHPYSPGFDTLGTLGHILSTGYEHSWFILTQKIIEKEFALSGSEQNPDLTGKDLRLLARRLGAGAPGPVAAFMQRGEDFVVSKNLSALLDGMQAISPEVVLDRRAVARAVRDRDAQAVNPFSKDPQLAAITSARRYRGDRILRVASPHRLLDPAAGPLIAVKLHVLSRKTLGGIETDLAGRVLSSGGSPVPGLFAAGEVAGFGGGGMHGYRALEGTFLGGCLFSGRAVGRSVARSM
jgi:predicted oxidoreductase